MEHVSIHAPVRERLDEGKLVPCYLVSIHAPVRERLHCLLEHIGGFGFNPRSREGATCLPWPQKGPGVVSIHAPVRERRVELRECRFGVCCFNPRSREGATTVTVRATSSLMCFNPRSREGATKLTTTRPKTGCFNPRSREGATVTDLDFCAYVCFNPRSREGATSDVQAFQERMSFQSTLP